MSGRDSNEDIFVLDLITGNLTQLTETPSNESFPAWSRSGGKIAFHSDRDGNYEIYTTNADGSNVSRITNSPARDGYPSWSPDGSQIVFQSDRTGNSEVFIINVDGSVLTNLTNHPAEDQDPAWSPDGQMIAFQSDRNGNPDIYRMNIDGEGVIPLTEDPNMDKFPAWSPDGQLIAFSSDRGGNYEIFVMNQDGKDLIQVTSDPPDYPYEDTYPSWGPDSFEFPNEPWFGPPFMASDSDGDFQPDTITNTITTGELTAFIFFPFHNMENGLSWNMNTIYDESEYSSLLFWENGISGIYSGNIPVLPQTSTAATVQFIVDDKVLQEIMFEIVEP